MQWSGCTSIIESVFSWECVKGCETDMVPKSQYNKFNHSGIYFCIPKIWIGLLFFNRQKRVPPFYYRLWWIVYVCGLFLENAKHPRSEEEGVSHTWMELLYFTVFTLKMNECILSPDPQSLSVLSPPPSQSLSFFNIFSLCPLLNSWLIVFHWHAVDGNVSGTNGGCQAGVHGQVGRELDSQWGLL